MSSAVSMADTFAYPAFFTSTSIRPKCATVVSTASRAASAPVTARARGEDAATELQTVDTIAAATSLAGALWQMATPGPRLRDLHTSDPRLGHAVVEVEPRLNRVLTVFLTGLGVESPATA